MIPERNQTRKRKEQDTGQDTGDPCTDNDSDGSCEEYDCDDNNPDVSPRKTEVDGNSVDDDCDGETDEYEGEGGDLDQDGDGFTPNDGDCRDTGDGAAFINPNAIEDLGPEGKGDEVDNDCDGETDEAEESCDCPEVANQAEDMVRAIGLCDDQFVLDAQMDVAPSIGAEGYGTLPSMGTNDCLVAHQGCEMAAISSGPVGQKSPNLGDSLGIPRENQDPLPDYQGNEPTTAEKYITCDRVQLKLQLKAPSNAVGFSFDFIFASSEYAEWVNKSYNDTFYAIMEYDDLNGGATTNISFDTNGNEIEVDTNFFENDEHQCNEAGSGWAPDDNSGTAILFEDDEKSGSTGWLRTNWNVKPGDAFKLTFSIHDEGDCQFDSIAFIDNWTWHTEPVEPGTEEIEPEPPI